VRTAIGFIRPIPAIVDAIASFIANTETRVVGRTNSVVGFGAVGGRRIVCGTCSCRPWHPPMRGGE
jgi:hypothetical protein